MYFIFFLVLLVKILAAKASFCIKNADKSLLFTDIYIGARAEALANTTITYIKDPTAVYFQPAALADTTSLQLLSGYMNWLADIKIGYLSIQLPTNIYKIGVQLTYLIVGDIESYDVEGNRIYIKPRSCAMSLGVGVGRKMSKSLNWGGTFKLLTERLDKRRVLTFALDIGQVFHVSEKLILATALYNITPISVKFYKKKYPLNLKYKIGTCYLLDNTHLFLTFTGEGKYLVGAVALEHELLKDFLTLRLGYDPAKFKNLSFGASFGLGINYKDWQINISYTPYNQFNDVLKLDINFKIIL